MVGPSVSLLHKSLPLSLSVSVRMSALNARRSRVDRAGPKEFPNLHHRLAAEVFNEEQQRRSHKHRENKEGHSPNRSSQPLFLVLWLKHLMREQESRSKNQRHQNKRRQQPEPSISSDRAFGIDQGLSPTLRRDTSAQPSGKRVRLD